MSTSEPTSCTRCGAPLPEGATEVQCPACLLSNAMSAPGDVTAFAPADFPVELGGYRLLGLLGTGGMGTVYEAEEVDTGRRVALKMLDHELDSSEIRQRFLREGRLAASVSHPNSLFVFGAEEIEGHPVITMEVAPSGTLEDRLRDRGPLPAAEAVDAMLDVVAGLQAAHARGVLHRDVKPSNCFVGPDGSVKVGDFGLSVSTMAREDSYATATGVIMGTPAFASPEQLRGDELDHRSDIYSVGATLYTLVSGHPPFRGKNAVQVVASVLEQDPQPLDELRGGVPAGLVKVVNRCLAKDPAGRFEDYAGLHDALLPFSSREPEPASIYVRTAAGWVDFLIAFLVPYVALMFVVGGGELLIRPLANRTLHSARHYLLLMGVGFLYFAIVEGIWGAGPGKRLKGLRVIKRGGGRPGILRSFVRVFIPMACVEGVRWPLMMGIIDDYDITSLQLVLFIVVANLCGWIPLLLVLGAKRENGFATFWDVVTGTRVVITPRGSGSRASEAVEHPPASEATGEALGPYRALQTIAASRWLAAMDPVLRRPVWLIRREGDEPSPARRNLARSGRLRWLQSVADGEAVWDAYEAPRGAPFVEGIDDLRGLPWSTLRHGLHDVAMELWRGAKDGTLPDAASLDHLWVTERGETLLLDEAWPAGDGQHRSIPIGGFEGQRRFLCAVAEQVEPTSVPLHARSLLQNLRGDRFEKLSFLTGSLRSLLDKPAAVGRGVRAGSVFLLPLFIWILVYVGYYHGGGDPAGTDLLGGRILIPTLFVLASMALLQLGGVPFRSTADFSVFRLAVVDAAGAPASIGSWVKRWVLAWGPLLLGLGFAGLTWRANEIFGLMLALVLVTLWLTIAIHAILHPARGLVDRWTGTWIVRR